MFGGNFPECNPLNLSILSIPAFKTAADFNTSQVVRVQDAHRGSSPVDAQVDQGPDVDFHEDVQDTRTEDGQTNQFDDKRTFELVMKNKLVVRLQAYNEITKREWMARLRKLIHYWKLRLASDTDTLKTVRGLNLKLLEIDEESEAYIGQFGSKWEVTRSVASPKLFNMCGISCCRAITVTSSLLLLALVLTNELSRCQEPFTASLSAIQPSNAAVSSSVTAAS